MKTTKIIGTTLLIAAAAIAFFQLPLVLAYAVGLPGLLLVCGEQ